MEKRSQYIIQFASLPQGIHEYEFQVNDAFFGLFEHSLIKKAEVSVKTSLIKGVNNLQFTFTFSGTVNVLCVRCLDDFNIRISEMRHLLVRLRDEPEEVEEEEDIVSIPLTAHEFDIAPHIYDYLSLMVPVNPVHPDKSNGASGCNQKTLKEMQNHLENPDRLDPRWDVLKNLKLK